MWWENSPNYTTGEERWDRYRQHEKRASGRYNSVRITRMKDRAGYNSLVLMCEDGGLPEASLDDGGTAEFSGLKNANGD